MISVQFKKKKNIVPYVVVLYPENLLMQSRKILPAIFKEVPTSYNSFIEYMWAFFLNQ